MSIKFNNKIIIQFIIFSIILFIGYKTFGLIKISESNKDQKNEELTSLDNNNLEEKQEPTNTMSEVEYSSTDMHGNIYSITGDMAELTGADGNILLLTGAYALITLKSSGVIEIYSKNAKYNINNFNTSFTNNVKILYEDNKVLTKNLDYKSLENKVIAYNGVLLDNNLNNTQVNAERIEFDLLTKNFKILSDENSKKISIIKKD